MAIALLDWDLVKWKQPICFNLEIMKMATYFRQQKREVTQFVHRFSPNQYSKTYIRKDYEDYEYPREIFHNDKVHFGGMVFSNQIYSPMDMEIESSAPDPDFYKKALKYYHSNAKNLYSNMRNALHLRFSLDQREVWKDWESQLPSCNLKKKATIIFHDKEVTDISGSLDALNQLRGKISKLQGGRVGSKYPIKLRDENEFYDWTRIPKLRNVCQNHVYCKVDDRLLADVEGSQDFYYIISPEYYTFDEFTQYYINQYYIQLVYLLNRKSKIIFLVEEGFLTPEWNMVIRLINNYSLYCHKYGRARVTLFAIDKRSETHILRRDMKRIFKFVQKENYDLFRMFYECIVPEFNRERTKLLEGGLS